VPFANELDVVGKKLGQVGADAEGFGAKLLNLSSGAALGAVAAIGAIGVEGVHLADQFEKAHARLEGAIANIGQSFEEEKGHVAGADSALEKLGFTNTETESSMARLVLATKDTATAQHQMSLAADIARGRGIDLASATQLLVQVDNGRYTQLSR